MWGLSPLSPWSLFPAFLEVDEVEDVFEQLLELAIVLFILFFNGGAEDLTCLSSVSLPRRCFGRDASSSTINKGNTRTARKLSGN